MGKVMGWADGDSVDGGVLHLLNTQSPGVLECLSPCSDLLVICCLNNRCKVLFSARL